MSAARARPTPVRWRRAAPRTRLISNAITGSGGTENGEPPSVQVGGEEVQPGTNGLFDLASASNEVPTPLLVALIALGLLALAGGFVALRGRVPALGRVPLLNKIPTPRVPFGKRR